jgi:hypothetical protein
MGAQRTGVDPETSRSGVFDRPISTFESRRRAPLHFEARADNARFSAYLLSKAPHAPEISALAGAIGYSGDPSIAVSEFNWEDWSRIYSVARSCFFDLRKGHRL